MFILSGIAAAVLILPPLLYLFLLSQFAVRNLWLPVVREKTGYSIDAAECGISLFGSQTCLFRKVKCSGKGLDLSADKFSLEMDPFLLIFQQEAKIEKIEIDGLNVKYAVKEKVKKTPAGKPSSGKSAPSGKNAARKPFRWSVREFQLSNSSFEIAAPGESLRIGSFGIKAKNLVPGDRAEISMEGTMEVSGKNEVPLVPFKTSVNMKMPEEGSSLPESVLAVCSAEKFRIASGNKDDFSARIVFNMQKRNSVISIQEASVSVTGKQKMSFAFSAKGELPQNKADESQFKTDEMTYSGTMKMNKVRIAPFADAVNKGKPSGASGEITSADLKFSGKGVTSRVWKKNLKAEFSAKTSNLSFPVSLEKASPSVRVIVAPLHYLPAALELMSINRKSPEIYELANRIKRVLSGRENLKLNRGTVRISASNGILNVRKCLFEGGTLKKESVEGTVNLLTEKLRLNAEIDTGPFGFPMAIGGTVSKPRPDLKKSLKKIRVKHVQDILESEQTGEAVQEANKLINRFLKKNRNRD